MTGQAWPANPQFPPRPPVEEGLGRTSWIVIGVVIAAFIGIIVLVWKMNSDQGNAVTTCEERCKSKCSTLDGQAACALVCQFSPSKAKECMDSSGGSCDTIGTCVQKGSP